MEVVVIQTNGEDTGGFLGPNCLRESLDLLKTGLETTPPVWETEGILTVINRRDFKIDLSAGERYGQL